MDRKDIEIDLKPDGSLGVKEFLPKRCYDENKPTPITGEWLWNEHRKILDNLKINRNSTSYSLLSEQINAHFGGKE